MMLAGSLLAGCNATQEDSGLGPSIDSQGGALLVVGSGHEPDHPLDALLFLEDDVLEPVGAGGIPEPVSELMNELADQPGVIAIHYFTREMAEEEFREIFADNAEMLKSLDDGLVLPASLRIWTQSLSSTRAVEKRYQDDPRIRSIRTPPPGHVPTDPLGAA